MERRQFLKAAGVLGLTAVGFQKEKTVLPITTEGWAELFAGTASSGDGMASYSTGSGWGFLTGDSIPRAGGPWAHNTITTVDKNGWARTVSGRRSADNQYQVVPNYPDGTYNWLGHGTYAYGRLYATAPHIQSSDGGWKVVGTDLIIFNGTSYLTTVETTSADDPIYWSGGIWYWPADGRVYVLGTHATPDDGWTGYDIYLMRLHSGWPAEREYWDGSWQKDVDLATPIMTNKVESAPSFWIANGTFHIVGKKGGNWSSDPITHFSASWQDIQAGQKTWPEEPLYEAPENSYSHYAHPTLPKLASGKRLYSYSLPGKPVVWVEA